jgi:cytochrome bd-type quinol oxidase subunit 2
LALVAVAVVAGLMLVVSTFLNLYTVGTGVTTLREYTGLDHHSIAMLLLGVAAWPMAVGALRDARPAMFALAALGVIVLVVAFTVDLPAALDEGLLAVSYEGAEAKPAAGFYVESLAGAMLLAAGGLLLMLGGGAAAAEDEPAAP